MASLGRFEKQTRATVKEIAYSPFGRGLARAITKIPDVLPVKKFLEAKGLDDYVRRLASQGLPDGKFYAKLTIGRWKPWEGKVIKLLHGDVTVFSAVVKPPMHGNQLIFRNIIVEAGQASEFRLDTDVPFKLAISPGAFTTQQQSTHEAKYQVSHDDGIHYGVRGNTHNPTRMIVAFPEHGEPSAPITYRINPLESISDNDLKSTIVLSFQDRYLHSGSYMTVDNWGHQLSERVAGVIESFRERHEISGGKIMFTGRHAGASMAIIHAKCFPESQLLIVAPHLILEHQHPVGTSYEEPRDLLTWYISQGRQIVYFSLGADLWNATGLAEDRGSLTIYRMSGVATSAAKAVDTTQKALIHQFLGCGSVTRFRCEEAKVFWTDEGAQIQLRVDDPASSVESGSWFVGGIQGDLKFFQLMSEHSLPFVKYTAINQLVLDGSGHNTEFSLAAAFLPDGSRWEAELPEVLTRPQGPMVKDSNVLEQAIV